MTRTMQTGSRCFLRLRCSRDGNCGVADTRVRRRDCAVPGGCIVMFLAAYFLTCAVHCQVFAFEVKSGMMSDCAATLAQRPDLALGCFWVRERDRWAVLGRRT